MRDRWWRRNSPGPRPGRQTQPFEPVAGPRLDPVPAEPEQVREEMAVGEDDREELTIGLAILVVKHATVEPHDTRIRLVEP